MALLDLFDTRYWDFTAQHFWEKLTSEHGMTRSYNWVRLTLQAHGRIQPAARRGAHRRKRPRRPMAGIMLRQDDRVVGNDNTVRYKGLTLQIPADRHRHHYAKATVRFDEYPDASLAVLHGLRCLARFDANGSEIANSARKVA